MAWHLSLVVLAFSIAVARGQAPRADIVIQDFEGDDYGTWTVEGKAFGERPARGTLPKQMPVSGFQGRGLASSFHGGDAATGKLTSPKFTVERDCINFLIGGGKFDGSTCLELLHDNAVVRSATGPNNTSGGSEALAAAHWNVKDLKGKTVTLRIVDAQTGGWGHISVDQIVQSDVAAGEEAKAVERQDRSREVAMVGPYLLFPISNAAKPIRMTIRNGDALLHDFDINLATDKADWWAHLDIPNINGQSLRIDAKQLPVTSKGLDGIESATRLRHLTPLYTEALRPQLRFSQVHGWNNDPNGMVYHDGEYHLFWQSNPFGNKWGNMYWGHAVSTDLIHWQELPYALRPRTMARSHCYSGSAHVDEHNSGGWQTGAEKTLVAAFTDTGAGEALAISRDRGRTWSAIPENPVIPKRKDEGRDPKLIWYEPGKHWVIAVFTKTGGKNFVEFYSSTNLKTWEKTSSLEGYYECPEMFELPVDGDATKKRWVLMAADAKYAVGAFDGKTFTPEHTGKHQVHYGSFYASQCFSRAPGGRVIQIGWARMDLPGMPFNQAFSLPIELQLKTTAAGVRLKANPIAELEKLRGASVKIDDQPAPVGKPLTATFAATELLDIHADIKVGSAKEVTLQFGANTLVYKVAEQTLDGMPLPLVDGCIRVRVVIDRPLYEVIGGDGAVYKTSVRKDGGKAIEAVTVRVDSNTATVRQLTVHALASIWKP